MLRGFISETRNAYIRFLGLPFASRRCVCVRVADGVVLVVPAIDAHAPAKNDPREEEKTVPQRPFSALLHAKVKAKRVHEGKLSLENDICHLEKQKSKTPVECAILGTWGRRPTIPTTGTRWCVSFSRDEASPVRASSYWISRENCGESSSALQKSTGLRAWLSRTRLTSSLSRKSPQTHESPPTLKTPKKLRISKIPILSLDVGCRRPIRRG